MTKSQFQPPKNIETERLLLRSIVASDLMEIYEKWGSNPRMSKYISYKIAQKPDDTNEFVKYAIAAWEDGREYTWMIQQKGRPGIIGSFGIRVRETDADFGYLLLPEFWGQGLIVEAGRPVLDWCLNLPNIWRIWCVCHLDNKQSARVMEKLGLTCEGIVRRKQILPQIDPVVPQDEYLYSVVK
jgi:ribosomal-protein-alanine N-acetyltransferase